VVPYQASGARLARRRLATALAGLVSEERLGDAVAIVTELVGNAIRHAGPLPGGVVRVAWRMGSRGVLLVRVTDGGPRHGSSVRPRVRPPSTVAVDGRGLAIVEALAARWGVECDGLGQCVWAELR
jgi:anti-sigma regulatory factor (Ser/Thr protein kinase)